MFCFFRLVDINEYMAGTINRVKKVDTNIPPTTATPMAIRPAGCDPGKDNDSRWKALKELVPKRPPQGGRFCPLSDIAAAGKG